ncbi:MAG: Zn-ribbon domain-containing OB-fold protein [Candidatus Omnitrophica bacterium]|nr:Zn-ribbon domain-containing OB-fold protein [Candidatus Omnitrophota bacterium]
MPPIVLSRHDETDYIHSYGENSPFFAGLAHNEILGTRCRKCKTKFATPRLSCLQCGTDCNWFLLPKTGRIHSWTKCYFGGESFLKETPYFLILVEFKGVNSLLLSRLKGVKDEKHVEINMEVEAHFSKKPKYEITDLWFEKK